MDETPGSVLLAVPGKWAAQLGPGLALAAPPAEPFPVHLCPDQDLDPSGMTGTLLAGRSLARVETREAGEFGSRSGFIAQGENLWIVAIGQGNS